jgi:tetratricopeptide (TPR) repeat protein
MLDALFMVALPRSRLAELARIAAEQLALARRLGDRQREVAALANAGWAARARGRLPEAARWLELALSTCDAQTPTPLRTRAMNGLALLHREAGRAETALPIAERSLALERERGQRRVIAICLINYAATLVDLDRLDEARAMVAEAIDLTRDASELLDMVDFDQVLAEIELRQGDWDAAAHRLRRVLESCETHADRLGAADALRALGEVAIAQGRPQEAIAPLRQALTILRRLDSPLEVARILARLDLAHTATAQPAPAVECRQEWQAILAELDLTEDCLRLSPVLRGPNRR